MVLAKIPHIAYKEIELVYNDLTGHRGVKATLPRLHNAGESWKHMHRDVMNYVRCCTFCKKIYDQKNQVHMPPFTTGGYG